MDASPIIPMTHVCRYWCKSIISMPENWTRISSERFGLAELSLERCKTAPLELRLDVYQGGITPGFSDLVSPWIWNTKVLSVDSHFTKEEFVQTLRNFLPSMTNLRSLSLFGGIGSGLLDWSDDPCGQLAPSLTYLHLLNIPLYPSFLDLWTLTNFTIFHSHFSLHLDTLLDFLEENCSLEYAVLHIKFTHPSLVNSLCRFPIRNRLRNLSTSSYSVADLNALISKITVQTLGARGYLPSGHMLSSL
jgi:hypothetical protein